jgi:flagellar biosynthesis protein FlhF
VTITLRPPNRQEGDPVRLKTFRAFTLAEALDAVHADLGTEAAILHTRTFKRGGFLGLGGREVVEIIASERRPETTILPAPDRVPEEDGGPLASPPSPRSLASARARMAYGAAELPRPSEGIEESTSISSGSLEIDRDRTRKLAQAMAVRLERQRAAREAAGVRGPDDLIGGPEQSQPTASAERSTIKPIASSPGAACPESMEGVERFVIGPDGVLLPEEHLRSAPLGAGAGRATHELEAIRRTVGRVLAEGGDPAALAADPEHEGALGPTATSDPLASAYAELVAQELSRDLAGRVIEAIESSLDPDARRDPARVRAAMLAQIAGLVPTEESLESTRPRDGRPRTIAFVGPTGVGKTTTLAKIAATLVLRDKVRVALVTADTYRISAVDQLRTYADILGARIEVAGDAAAMREAIARCGDVDAILVDTPGRSQNDADRLAELRGIVDAARPHETHLVLSGTASERVLLREAEAFSSLGPDRVVLTKLDEAVAFGMLVSVVRRIGRRISWVTTGQEVPRDIERATGSRLADLVLGGAVRA